MAMAGSTASAATSVYIHDEVALYRRAKSIGRSNYNIERRVKNICAGYAACYLAGRTNT